MSRFGDLDGEGPDFPNQQAFINHAYEQALVSKRGRKALAELREALLALPERILIFGSLCTVQDQTRYDRDYRDWLEPEPEDADPIIIPSGQMELLDLGELPEPVPDGPGRWIDGMAPPQVKEAGGEGVCLVGAFAWYKQVQAGKTPEEAFAALPTLYYDDDDGDGPFETAWEGQKAGLTYQLAWRLGTLNDEYWQELTPAGRWQKAMDWIDEQLAKPYDPKLAR